MSEFAKYKTNLQEFITTMQCAFIEKVTYKEDTTPTFDKDALPFNFKYCLSTTFYTDKGSFLLTTAMTSSGEETFWIEQVDPKDSGELAKIINSRVKDVRKKNGHENLPYKLSIEFENDVLTFFAAEVYDNENSSCLLKINDEMILVFEDSKDVEKFEATLN